MSNTNENENTLELRVAAGDAAGLVRAMQSNDGAGVAGLLSAMDPKELQALTLALAGMVPMAWRAAYRAGVRFGSLNVPDHELDEFGASEDLAGLSAAELTGYLSAVAKESRRSS
ncbi:hypothetical protein [Glutamicibacter arilaitensis]|uniref:hypothetical protein n=1 Tax=Glutamicibacter arilaitensis TaxID=256701 RepID=UPI003FD43A29